MGLLEDMRNEPVRRLALRDPVTASRSTTLREAVELMRKKRLGCTIVIDENDKPVGMLTEHMLTQLLAHGNTACIDEPLENHMADQWAWVRLDDPVMNVVEAMEQNNTRFLCVLDNDGRVAGLTGQKSLMEYVADHFPGQVMVQRIGGKAAPEVREGA